MKKKIYSWNPFEIRGFTLLELIISMAIASLLILVIGSILKSTLSFGVLFPKAIARSEDLDFVARTMRDEVLAADEILSVTDRDIQLYTYDENLVNTVDGPHTYVAYENGKKGVMRIGRHGKKKVSANQWKGKDAVTNTALRGGTFTCEKDEEMIKIIVTLEGERREVMMAIRGRDE